MDVEQQAFNILGQWLDLEARVVSYRELARELQINVNVAKSLLAKYLESDSSLHPTYLISGDYLADDDDQNMEAEEVSRRGMMLVGGKDKLEEQKQYFRAGSISVHVYALSKARVKDPAHYLQATSRVRMYTKQYDSQVYGTTQGSFTLATSRKPGESSKPIEKPAAPVTKSKPVEKPVAKSAPQAAPPPATKEAPKARPPSSGKANKRVTSEEPPETKPDVADADRLAMEAMMDMSDGLDHSSPAKRSSAQVPAKRSADGVVVGKSESGRFKKKRRVTKSVMKTDAKGYMFTEDISESEYYSSDNEGDTSKARKPAPQRTASNESQPAAKAKGKKGQQTMLSFFKKN